MFRHQVFTLDLFLSLLAFLAIIPVLIYLQYNYSFKILHLKKVNVMVARYYPVANILMSVCLAKIDNNTGKLIPYYFRFNETVMFAADNFTNIQDGLNYICEKIFGYNESNSTQYQLYQDCVQRFQPYVELCRYLDTRYKWFLMDRYGAVYFISKALRDSIPGSTRLEKRLFLAYVMDRYIYGKSYPTLNFPDYQLFESSWSQAILVPAAGVSGDYAPVYFVQLADGLYARVNRDTADSSIMMFLTNVWNIRKNFTPENLPVGVITNEYEFMNYLRDPEYSIAINLHGDAFPGVYELVKNATDWECINDTTWLEEHYLAGPVSRFLSKVIWINVWGYPAYYLESPYCNDTWYDNRTGRGFIKLGVDSLSYLGITPGFNTFSGSLSFTVTPEIASYFNATFGIALPRTVTGTSSLGSCTVPFYYGSGCLGYARIGSGGIVELGGASELTSYAIVYLEQNLTTYRPKPVTFFVVFLDRISFSDERQLITTLSGLR